MTHTAGHIGAEQDGTRQLEQLGDELCLRRGMHVSLAPATDGRPLLEVVSDLPKNTRTRRVSWRDGSFWLGSLERVPGSDISCIADWIAAALGWSRQIGLTEPRGAPRGT